MLVEPIEFERGIQFALERLGQKTRDQLVRDYHDRVCSGHSDKEHRSFVISGGAVQIRYQCLVCGEPVGNSLPKAEFKTQPPPADSALRERYRDTRQAELDAIISKSKADYKQMYYHYLATTDWRRKRELVLERCAGSCEGCRERAPTEVHHLTYAHVFNELLYELVALCEPCHERAHYRDHDADLELETVE